MRIIPTLLMAAALTSCAPKVTQLDTLLAARSDQEAILIFREDSEHMRSFVEGFNDELEGEFELITYAMTDRTRSADMAAAIDQLKPSSVVLIDNPTVEQYRAAREQVADPSSLPPAMIVMSLFLDEISAGMDEVVGVYYEIPGVTTFRKLRTVMTEPVKKVGVLYRPRFSSFIERQTSLAELERFELIPIEMSDKPTARDVSSGLEALEETHDVDALWVLSDNGLLTPELLMGAWLPSLADVEVPVMVGVTSLLELQQPFGHFAVLPDHEQLGMQAAQLIYTLADYDWDVEEVDSELPIAVETVLRADIAEERFSLRAEALEDLDRIIRPE